MRERTAQKQIRALFVYFLQVCKTERFPPAINIRHKLNVHAEAREKTERVKEREGEERYGGGPSLCEEADYLKTD